MKFVYIRLTVTVTFLICLLVAVLAIAPYSKTIAVIIWFLGSGSLHTLKYLKPLQKLLNQPQIEKIDLLDTEYAAIVAASRSTTGESLYNPAAVVKAIVSYRTATKQSVKDVLLCSLGNHLQLFTPQQKQEIAQQNKQLDDNGRLRVKEVLLEQLGITL